MKRVPIAMVLVMTLGLAAACSGEDAPSVNGGQASVVVLSPSATESPGITVPPGMPGAVPDPDGGDEDAESEPDEPDTLQRGPVIRAQTDMLPANEASGLVASQRHLGVFYWLRDGGTAKPGSPRSALWSLRLDGNGVPKPVRQSVLFPYASVFSVQNGDWEDVVMDDDDNLWIGDIGANDCNTQQYLYKTLEPDPGTGDPFIMTSKYPIRIPDPKEGCRTRNAETMLWLDGALYIFAKTDASPVYRAEPAERNTEMPLVRVAEFDMSSVKNISAASVSGDRTRLMVAGHTRFWVFEADPSLRGDEFLRDAMRRSPSYEGRFESAGGNASVEGGSYVPDSRDMIFVAEDRHIFHVRAEEYGDVQPESHKPLPD